MELWLFFTVFSVVAGYAIGEGKGRPAQGLMLGGLLGIFGLIILLCLSSVEKDTMTCPYCREKVNREALVCRHCRSKLPVYSVPEENTDQGHRHHHAA